MAQLSGLSVVFLCCLIGVICDETIDSKFKDAAQFVLDSFNDLPGSVYVYDSAKIINAYENNDSLPSLYFMQLDITVTCNSSVDCTPSHLICELVLRENSSTDTKGIYEDRTKCARKEAEPIFPTNEHGFHEESVSDEIRSIASFAVQQLESNGDVKRSVIDVMSVKRQVAGNSTTLYLTLKVTRTDGGDASLFEVCEAEVNQTAEMALESNLTCFPLSGMLPGAPMNAADVTSIAGRAADELDSLSFSEFTLKLVDVLRAETTVTPGSEGTVTTLELRLVPTLCLKNVDTDGDTDGLYEKRQCPENVLNRRIICSITSWDRPWIEDTLYSEPACHEDAYNGGIDKHPDEDHQESSLDTMMDDQIEPLNEEMSLPAVGSHSIPVVEELDPIVEQVEKSQTPVVEEPIIATHTYCTGCPTDIDVSNPALQDYVDQALAVIDEGSRGKYMHRATRIAKAQKQVVNGVKYILQLEVTETSCLKGSTQDRTSCEPNMDSVRICLVEFLEKPWLDSSREIISNNCTYYNNDLENEIEPHFAPNNQASRQEIFDYLDSLIEPDLVTAKIPSSYGRDSLYLPENEPEDHHIETDAEQIDVNNPDGEQKKSDRSEVDEPNSESTSEKERISKSEVDTEESEETKQSERQKLQDPLDESDQSSESNERQKKIMEKFAEYVTGESRNRRETTPRSVPGGLKDIDKSEVELVNKLAEIAVQTLDEIDEDDKKRVVLGVLGAQKQIVNGVMYHLQLRVGTTSCSENGDNKPDCVKHHSSPVKICRVELHRSFTDDSNQDAKVVKSECTTEERILPEKKVREKRSGGKIVVSGTSPANVSDPYITRLADFAVSELDKGTNSLYTQCVVRIVSASKQVVAGYNVFLVLELGESIHRKGETNNSSCELNENSEVKICHVTVWDRPWLENAHRVTSFNCSASESRSSEELSANRVKRQAGTLVGAPGAPAEADVNDSYIQEMASTALAEVDRRSNALYRQKVVRIVSAQKQVVAGTLVRLTLELGYTSCRKGEDGDISNCQLKEDSNNQICYIEIWDRPWLNLREVTNVSCSSGSENAATSSVSRSKRELSANRVKRQGDALVGAPAEADVNDSYIQEMASTALAEVDRRSNALYRQKVVRIVNAQKQVVAGTLVRLTLELGYTSCRKGEDGDISNCQLKEDSNNQICYIAIWDRPWLNLREVTNVSCSSSSENAATSSSVSRSKRELSANKAKKHTDVLVGATTEADINDSYIQDIASTALAEVDRRSNALYRQKVVRIVEAQKQVVAGVLVRLTLELGYSTCRKGHDTDIATCQLKNDLNNQICHVEVWDRPWLKQREVKSVSCSSVERVKRRSWIGGGSHDIHLGLFNEYLDKYNKHYPNRTEYKRRFHIFRANMKKVERLQKTEQGTAVYGATQFADLTPKEFKKYHLGLNRKLKVPNHIPLQEAKIPDVTLPKEFDWRKYNIVTEVKNQGLCGSCWAFSVTGNVEGQWALKKGKLYSLSEQELVDCDTLDDGCNGGLPENAYKAIESLGGLETEKDYPYEGENEKCHFKKSDVKVTVQGALNITKNETQMAQWLYKNGPISIGINANAMQFYMGGISHPWKFLCDGEDLDHGVLIVGFGVRKTSIRHRILPYWIIKNSWGTFWGEQGYYRVYRGDGTCGVNQMATSAIVG